MKWGGIVAVFTIDVVSIFREHFYHFHFTCANWKEISLINTMRYDCCFGVNTVLRCPMDRCKSFIIFQAHIGAILN